MARGNSSHVRLLTGGILAAGCIMFLRVLAVTALLNPQLSLAVAPVLLVSAVTMGAIAFAFVTSSDNADDSGGRKFALKNPFDISEVLRFGALLAIVTLAVTLARNQSGDIGVLAVAAISGLVDVDAITLSVARFGEVSAIAVNAILAAVAMNTLAKGVYTWLVGGMRIGLLTIGSSGLVLIAALLTWGSP
jgi:uncharacterized membrane protein (DUF4010 family)